MKEAVKSSVKTIHPKETGSGIIYSYVKSRNIALASVEKLFYLYSTTATERPAIECRKCKQSFKRQKRLNRHLKEVCGVDERKFHCKECGLKFKQKMCLRRHLMNIHKVDRTQLAAYGIGKPV